MKQRICISVDKSVLKDIDKVRDYAARSSYINHILKKHLEFRTAKELLGEKHGQI